MKKRGLRIIRHLILIAAASIVYAAGVSLFLDPNNLAPGGVTGVSVIRNRNRNTVFSVKCSDCFAGDLEIRLALYYENCLCDFYDFGFYKSFVRL